MQGRGRAAVAGVVAGAVALAVAELAAGALPGDTSPVGAVAAAVISLAPGAVADLAISTLGGGSRLALAVGIAGVGACGGALIGVAAVRRWWVAPAGIGAFAAVGAVALLADPLSPAGSAVAAPAVGAVAGIAALRWLLTRVPAAPASTPGASTAGASSTPDASIPGAATAGASPGEAATPLEPPRLPPPPVPTRRAFLGAVAPLAVAAVAAAGGGRLLLRGASKPVERAARGGELLDLPRPTDPLPRPPVAANIDVDGVAPLLTPNDDFFRIDTAFGAPRIDPATHSVRITGMIDRPYALTMDELLDLADTEADVTLACVSNEVGGDLVGTARWLGVALETVLDRAGVQPEATQVVGRAIDGWTAGFPVEAVYDGREALVAVGMNGAPLPREHGFPVRLVVAGLYGYVSDTKWLSEIELTTFEAYDAYWIERGWAERAPIKTQSRIDTPRPGAELAAGTVPVAGVAWAGEHGVADVEVAIDDGPWQPAEVAAALGPATWRQWVYRWEASPGPHRLRVRATDGDGQTQTAESSPPMPDGATGHHEVEVTVA